MTTTGGDNRDSLTYIQYTNEFVPAIQYLESRYPSRLRVFTYGTSVEGRGLYAVELTDENSPVAYEDRNIIPIDISLHASERSPAEEPSGSWRMSPARAIRNYSRCSEPPSFSSRSLTPRLEPHGTTWPAVGLARQRERLRPEPPVPLDRVRPERVGDHDTA